MSNTVVPNTVAGAELLYVEPANDGGWVRVIRLPILAWRICEEGAWALVAQSVESSDYAWTANGVVYGEAPCAYAVQDWLRIFEASLEPGQRLIVYPPFPDRR